jgi:hypothetical protein
VATILVQRASWHGVVGWYHRDPVSYVRVQYWIYSRSSRPFAESESQSRLIAWVAVDAER